MIGGRATLMRLASQQEATADICQLTPPITLPPVPVQRETGWGPELLCRVWRMGNIWHLSGIEPRLIGRLAHSPVTILTKLNGSKHFPSLRRF